MHICGQYKYAFVKVPKAASNSLHRMMEEVGRMKSECAGKEKPRIKHTQIHYTANEIRAKIPNQWDRYFTFAFVRNPWDRWMSWYYYRTYHPTHGIHREFQGNPLGWLKKFGGHEGLYNQYIWNQLDFLTDEHGEIIVDFIGSIGHFYEHFLWICNHLGLPGARNRRLNYGMRDYYPNDETPEVRKYIAKMCKRDISFFGFRPGTELERPIIAERILRLRGMDR